MTQVKSYNLYAISNNPIASNGLSPDLFLMESDAECPKTAGGRIAWLIDAVGLNQSGFSTEIGITEATVSTWVNDRRMPQRSNLNSMAQFVRVSPALMTAFIERGEHFEIVRTQIEKSLATSHGAPRTTGMGAHGRARPENWPAGKIPVVGVVPGGNGRGISDYEGTWAQEWVDQHGPGGAGPNSQAMIVRGDSMSPALTDGQMVMVIIYLTHRESML